MKREIATLIRAAGRVHEARHSEGPEVEAALGRAERLLYGAVARLSATASVAPEEAGSGRFLPHNWRDLAR
jgi:hypothetical protein